METNLPQPIIYVISDSIGETAERVAQAAASQFNSGGVEIKRLSYINDPNTIDEIIEEAKQYRSAVVYTLVNPELRRRVEERAMLYDLPTVDIMGPMLVALSKVMAFSPKLEPGLIHKLDKDYFRRVEAVEFAVKFDDGKDPRGLSKADIVLIGVSRTSKTPLSMYLAHKKLKVANIPLVPEVNPPEELFNIPRTKIIGLKIAPHKLNEIRQERLKTLGLSSTAEYASMERILKELDYAQGIMRRLQCPVIDVTNKAIEETANKVLEIYYRGGKKSE